MRTKFVATVTHLFSRRLTQTRTCRYIRKRSPAASVADSVGAVFRLSALFCVVGFFLPLASAANDSGLVDSDRNQPAATDDQTRPSDINDPVPEAVEVTGVLTKQISEAELRFSDLQRVYGPQHPELRKAAEQLRLLRQQAAAFTQPQQTPRSSSETEQIRKLLDEKRFAEAMVLQKAIREATSNASNDEHQQH